MGVKFSGSDIVAMGLEIEKNGKEYYEGVVKCSKSAEAKKMFEMLVGEELKHVSYFEKLLVSLEQEEIAESYAGEYHEYMSHLAGLHIFKKAGAGKEKACKITSDKEALETAASFEKDSILFYYELKNFIIALDQQVLDEVIEQEKIHLSKIMELLKKY
ncbi:MAG: ferritin family protein [Candidatus Firestonebacteria bacterium]